MARDKEVYVVDSKTLDVLSHVVQCRETKGKLHRHWSTIAAFDVDVVAEIYAKECRESNRFDLEYRVVEIER